jgi:hypothetical protein
MDLKSDKRPAKSFCIAPSSPENIRLHTHTLAQCHVNSYHSFISCVIGHYRKFRKVKVVLAGFFSDLVFPKCMYVCCVFMFFLNKGKRESPLAGGRSVVDVAAEDMNDKMHR